MAAKRVVSKSMKRRLKVQRRAKAEPEMRPCLADQPYDYSEGTTNSMQSDWQDCRHRAKLKLEGYRREKTSEALEFGSLFHSILEHAYGRVITGEIKGWKQASWC